MAALQERLYPAEDIQTIGEYGLTVYYVFQRKKRTEVRPQKLRKTKKNKENERLAGKNLVDQELVN